MKITFLVVIAILFGIARFFMPTHPLSPHGTYEAFAHLFVGGLIGAWLVSREKEYGLLAIALTLLELTAFLTLK